MQNVIPFLILHLRDMPSIDESRIGLNGSPTRVRKVYQPPLRGKVEMLPSIEEGAKRFLNWLIILSLKNLLIYWCQMMHQLR